MGPDRYWMKIFENIWKVAIIQLASGIQRNNKRLFLDFFQLVYRPGIFCHIMKIFFRTGSFLEHLGEPKRTIFSHKILPTEYPAETDAIHITRTVKIINDIFKKEQKLNTKFTKNCQGDSVLQFLLPLLQLLLLQWLSSIIAAQAIQFNSP